jgi:hypothetical protein
LLEKIAAVEKFVRHSMTLAALSTGHCGILGCRPTQVK